MFLHAFMFYSASSHGGSEPELHHNDTVVDMQALDAHFSKKIADDTKTHHMLDDNLIVPRARVRILSLMVQSLAL